MIRATEQVQEAFPTPYAVHTRIDVQALTYQHSPSLRHQEHDST